MIGRKFNVLLSTWFLTFVSCGLIVSANMTIKPHGWTGSQGPQFLVFVWREQEKDFDHRSKHYKAAQL